MRDFLATNYDGDIKAKEVCYGYEEKGEKKQSCMPPTSDYADLRWSDIQKMSGVEIKKSYNNARFPNASVSANDHIWYTDTSWQQVDFYYLKNFNSLDESNHFFRIQENRGGSDISWSTKEDQWVKEKIGGLGAELLVFETEKDADGNEMITKGGTGGKIYYVSMHGGKDMFVIFKQAKGDVQYETDFTHLIDTLKFE